MTKKKRHFPTVKQQTAESIPAPATETHHQVVATEQRFRSGPLPEPKELEGYEKVYIYNKKHPHGAVEATGQ